jgi:hypothetical protein
VYVFPSQVHIFFLGKISNFCSVPRHKHDENLKFALLQIATSQISMFLEKKSDFATSFGVYISIFGQKKPKLLPLTVPYQMFMANFI